MRACPKQGMVPFNLVLVVTFLVVISIHVFMRRQSEYSKVTRCKKWMKLHLLAAMNTIILFTKK